MIRFAHQPAHAACSDVSTTSEQHADRPPGRAAGRALWGASVALVLAGSAAWVCPSRAHAADTAQGATPVKAVAAKPATHPAAQPSAVVRVEGAWVRPTVPGQTATGGFMSLTAERELTLVGFSTPAARETELHEMVMDGDVMRMRAIEALKLPAGQTVTLKPGPGGQHLMLMGLKKPVSAGQRVALTLKLRTPEGRLVQQVVQVPVQMSATPGGAAAAASDALGAHDAHGAHGAQGGHDMGGHHHHGHDMKHPK